MYFQIFVNTITPSNNYVQIVELTPDLKECSKQNDEIFWKMFNVMNSIYKN